MPSKSIVLIGLEPDFSEVEKGTVEAYRVNVPALKFGELKGFFDREVDAGCKVDLRIANDYLDFGSVELSKMTGQGIDKLLAYCVSVIKTSPPAKGQAKLIDVSQGWSSINSFILPERLKHRQSWALASYAGRLPR
jgi:hypothetical protein